MFIGLVVKDLNESWGFFYVQHFRRRAALSNVQRLKAVRHLTNAVHTGKNAQICLLMHKKRTPPFLMRFNLLTNHPLGGKHTILNRTFYSVNFFRNTFTLFFVVLVSDKEVVFLSPD
jgi:hypothetical protein